MRHAHALFAIRVRHALAESTEPPPSHEHRAADVLPLTFVRTIRSVPAAAMSSCLVICAARTTILAATLILIASLIALARYSP